MTSESENTAAAQRYLAGRFAAGTATTSGVASEAQAQRRAIVPLRASGLWRRLCGGLEALRRHATPRPRMLSVTERLDLGAKKSLWIVAHGERQFLVAGGAEMIAAMVELAPAKGDSRDRIPVMAPARWMD